MVKVLIVGANGFLGRHLALACISRGWVVDVVINKSEDHLPPGINKVLSLSEAGDVGYSYIFNVAAYIPYGAYDVPDEQLTAVNVELPRQIHLRFPGAKVIYASTVGVYGQMTGTINECSPSVLADLYGQSKLSGEEATAHHSHYAVVRFSSLYGRGMYGHTFLPNIVRDAKSKKTITLYGSGERKQNYLHISDAAAYCIAAALCDKNGVYLGVSGRSYTNKEVAETVANYTGAAISYQGADNSRSVEYDNSYTRDTLNFNPVVGFEEGIKDIIND